MLDWLIGCWLHVLKCLAFSGFAKLLLEFCVSAVAGDTVCTTLLFTVCMIMSAFCT